MKSLLLVLVQSTSVAFRRRKILSQVAAVARNSSGDVSEFSRMIVFPERPIEILFLNCLDL
jgi:hypothetical protein